MSVIKRSKVQVLEGPPAALPARPNASSASRDEQASEPCEKEVRLVRLGGEVRAVELSCSCGETTTIEIQYADADAAPTPEPEPAPAAPQPAPPAEEPA